MSYRALLLLGSFAWMSTQRIAHSADRPNFVWLIGEDCSKHFFRLFDEHGAETPNIAALAERGIAFDRAFSCAPVCSVARTTLLTSCYAPRIAAQFHRRTEPARLPGDLRMFPAYLRDAGYYATNRQKKDYNVVESPDVWDESSARATWRNRAGDQPFFHMQSFGVSHESSLHFTAEAMRDEPTTTNPATVFVPPIHPDTPTFRYTYARYHDRIMDLDRQVGAVVDELERDGLLDETFIFFFGDHGGVLPGSKGYVYETGLHVPLVAYIPERWAHLVSDARGSRSSQFVSFVDLGPTLLHLAGADAPTEIDGRPFLEKDIADAAALRPNEAFGYADRFDEKIDLVRSLRLGKYKYVRSYQPFYFDALQNNYRYRMLAYREWRDLYQAGELTSNQAQFFLPRSPEALFDLEADPYELNNLADDSEYATKLVELRSLLNSRLKDMPDLSFFPEHVLVDQALADPVAFGQTQRTRIERLIDVADAQLVDWRAARRLIAPAIGSDDPWERYWGLIAATTHGADAAEFLERAREIAAGDDQPLVRAQAAAFLALTAGEDPAPALLDALQAARSGPEANEILNTLVMLRDGRPGFAFPDVADHVPAAVAEYDGVQRRLEYLAE